MWPKKKRIIKVKYEVKEAKIKEVEHDKSKEVKMDKKIRKGKVWKMSRQRKEEMALLKRKDRKERRMK